MRIELYDGTNESLEWLKNDGDVFEVQHNEKLGMCEIILADGNYFSVQNGDFICKNEMKQYSVIDIDHSIYSTLKSKGLSKKESIEFIKNMNDGKCY